MGLLTIRGGASIIALNSFMGSILSLGGAPQARGGLAQGACHPSPGGAMVGKNGVWWVWWVWAFLHKPLYIHFF